MVLQRGSHCHALTIPSQSSEKSLGGWNDLVVLSKGDDPDTWPSTVQFILYVPSGSQAPPVATLGRLRGVLLLNPSIAAVGGNTIHNNVIKNQCQDIEVCHWTLLLHLEYTCSVGPYMQCGATSPVFMTRRRYAPLLVGSKVGDLTPLSFFVKLSSENAIVLTDNSVTIDIGTVSQPTTQQHHAFVRMHGIDEIRNRDTGQVTSLCTNYTCDAQIVKAVFDGKSWASSGTSMPIFAYKAYVRALQHAVSFLNKNNVVYHLYGGGELGMFKLGRLLPWDSGDVDIIVDQEQFSCGKWLSMLKSWADSQHFIHPHRDPAGARCAHYGVYAMPRRQNNGRVTDVQDPFSIGLVTFTRKKLRNVQTSFVYAHGVAVRVRTHQWDVLEHKYTSTLLQHKTHSRREHRCSVPALHKHNCLIDTDGTHLDTCMEYTRFGMSVPAAAAAPLQTTQAPLPRTSTPLPSNSFVLFESRHDQYAKTTGHFIERFYPGKWPSEMQMQQILFELLVYARDFCRRHSVPFQLYAGTLLGAWRHHAIIPWDVDADVVITSDHLKQLVEILRQSVDRRSTTYQWIVRKGKHSDIIPVKLAHIPTGLYVDFFVIYPNGRDWKNGLHKRIANDVLFPALPCVFGTMRKRAIFHCPQDPRKMLDQYSTFAISTKDQRKFPFVVEFHSLAQTIPEARARLAVAKSKRTTLNQTDWSYYIRDESVPRE